MELRKWRKLVKSIDPHFTKVTPSATYCNPNCITDSKVFPKHLLNIVSDFNVFDVNEVSTYILKFAHSTPQISFLHYPTLYDECHPHLSESVTLNLNTGKITTCTYKSDNPPILHRAETMGYKSFTMDGYVMNRDMLTQIEEEHNLYEEKSKIGYRKFWNQLVENTFSRNNQYFPYNMTYSVLMNGYQHANN